MEPFSPVEATPEAVEKAEEAVASTEAETEDRRAAKSFTPMSSDPNTINLVANSAVGGDNWPPSSFNPEEDMYFVCSQSGALGLVVPPEPTEIHRRRNVHRVRHDRGLPASTRRASSPRTT